MLLIVRYYNLLKQQIIYENSYYIRNHHRKDLSLLSEECQKTILFLSVLMEDRNKYINVFDLNNNMIGMQLQIYPMNV